MYHVNKLGGGIAYRFGKEKITLGGAISNSQGLQ